MLWVYDHKKYLYSYSAGIDFSHQNLMTKVDPYTVRDNVQSYSHLYQYASIHQKQSSQGEQNNLQNNKRLIISRGITQLDNLLCYFVASLFQTLH